MRKIRGLLKALVIAIIADILATDAGMPGEAANVALWFATIGYRLWHCR